MPITTDFVFDADTPLEQRLQVQTLFNQISRRIHESENLNAVLLTLESDFLTLMHTGHIIVYQREYEKNELTRQWGNNQQHRIKIPLSMTSIAGYIALSHADLCINNVHNIEELAGIHPELRFNQDIDSKPDVHVRSMIAVPIRSHDVVLGVLHVLNRVGHHGVFSSTDLNKAKYLADILGQKLHYDLHKTQGLYDYLIQQKKLSRKQLTEYEEQARRENKTMSSLLMSQAHLLPLEIGASLERYYQVPYMAYSVDHVLPEDLLSHLNLSYLRKHLWLPVAQDANEITILIDNPMDSHRIMEIEKILHEKHYIFRVGLPEDILRYLGKSDVGLMRKDVGELISQLKIETNESFEPKQTETADEEEAEAEANSTIIQLVNQLILDAYHAQASDIHIEPRKPNQSTMVRFRIDGVCQAAAEIPAQSTASVIHRIKVMARLNISEKRIPLDGKLMVKYLGQTVELRIATIPTVNGESVVMRILANSKLLPLDEINISPRNLKLLTNIINKPHGFLLVTGPTGSGKTTTLHAILRTLNTPERKIWTAEDPVEITQEGLLQVQINTKVDFTFARALRAFLRADPDVIMIGEMRDVETTKSVIQAALTGHFVLSTLHTNSAIDTITRLLELGMEPTYFADAFQGVLAQRLARTLCAECKQAYPATEKEIKQLRFIYGEPYWGEIKSHAQLQLYQANGCEHCNGTGYKGRIGVHELLVYTKKLQALLYENASTKAILEASLEEGMRTLAQDGVVKTLAGYMDMLELKKLLS